MTDFFIFISIRYKNQLWFSSEQQDEYSIKIWATFNYFK